ncbi:MAG: AbrB/MazE/SpoVT family DNA-binding domain-containing protein [Panacagrimonas sp.]
MNSPTTPSMSAVVSMDASGRLVLPKLVRELLQLRAGAKFTAEVVGGRIELTPEIDNEGCEIVEKDGLPVIRSRSGKKVDVVAAIKADREARIRHILRR